MDFLTFFVLFGELLVLTWAFFRSGFMPFPHGFMIYIILAQTFLWLNVNEILYYRFLDVFSTGAYIEHYRSVLLLLGAFFAAATLCVPKARIDIKKILEIKYAKNEKIEEIYIFAVILLLYSRLVLHFLYIDWSVAWRTDEYMRMGTALALEDSLGLFLSRTAFLFGVLAVIFAAFLAGRKKWSAFFILLPLVGWHVFFELASHSRIAVTYFLAGGLATLVLRPGRLGAPGLLFTGGIVALLGSLAGRVSGHHGFSSLPFYLTNIFQASSDYGDLTNMFEGAFVTAELFAQNFEYNPIYKTLAMSPLLSFMDGYDTIRQQYQIKLHFFVPSGAVIEVVSFGPIHATIFFGVQFVAGWLSARTLARRQTPLALFINSAVLLAAYLQFTYSVRTVFRLFLIAAGISLYLLHRWHKEDAREDADRLRDQRRAEVPPTPAGGRSDGVLAAGAGAPGRPERVRRRARDTIASPPILAMTPKQRRQARLNGS